MVRVKKAGLRWRALRPVLLAGAATVTWLTFSSTAAHAEPIPSPPTIPGNITSSVPAAPETLTNALPALALSGSQNLAELGRNGVPQPLTAAFPDAAGDPIFSVPLIDGRAANPVAGVIEQVRQTGNSLISGTADTVSGLTGPLGEAVADAQPAAQPLLEQAEQSQLLPNASRKLSPLTDHKPSAASGNGGTADTRTDNTAGARHNDMWADPATAVEAPGISPANGTNGASVVDEAAGGKGVSSRTSSPDVAVLTRGGTQPLDRSPYPLHVPSHPAGFAAGTFGSAAGSDHADRPYPFRLHSPPAGLCPLGNLSKHVPCPASYDPGSSPD